MTTLDPLTEPLVRLFLRIDAAHPTDLSLRAVFEFWRWKRADMIAPDESEISALPSELLPLVFHARLTINGGKNWSVLGVGSAAATLLGITEGDLAQAADKRAAVRLRRLFDIVAERTEPYSAMFEINSKDRGRQFVEVFAAPLRYGGKGTRMIFAAANGRVEATN
jgi:ribose-phosphate pyrophosphokinase